MKYIEAAINDLDKIYAIVQETIKTIYPKYYPAEVVDFFAGLHSPDNIRRDIENRMVGMLFSGETIIGTGTCTENHITRVFVLPEYQGKGYGSYIMQQLEDKVSQKHDKAILDASLPASLFYENRGYVTVRHETWNCENDTVLVYGVMEKQL